MIMIISILSQKGGSGKTTLAVAQGIEFAKAKFPKTQYLTLTDADIEH